MKERPILFSDAMVRAILAGTKTQTRRVVQPQPVVSPRLVSAADDDDVDDVCFMEAGELRRRARWGSRREPCPYGAPGDRLWVREAWGVRAAFDFTDWRRDTLRGCTEAPPGTEVDFRADYGPQQEACFWRPSIHMPRWASRLTLKITSVRVERVQEISQIDARAEGVDPTEHGGVFCTPDYRGAFASLWDSINGEREDCSWAANPWVWCIGFRRVEAGR